MHHVNLHSKNGGSLDCSLAERPFSLALTQGNVTLPELIFQPSCQTIHMDWKCSRVEVFDFLAVVFFLTLFSWQVVTRRSEGELPAVDVMLLWNI